MAVSALPFLSGTVAVTTFCSKFTIESVGLLSMPAQQHIYNPPLYTELQRRLCYLEVTAHDKEEEETPRQDHHHPLLPIIVFPRVPIELTCGAVGTVSNSDANHPTQ
eukprot:252252-Amphidinium_carterae.1